MFGLERDISLIIGLLGAITALIGGVWKVISDILADKRLDDNLRKQTTHALENLTKTTDEILTDMKDVKEIAYANREGIKTVEAYRLYYDMTEAILKGFTYNSEYTEITRLYCNYKSLGGNGTIEQLYERYDRLDIVPDNSKLGEKND